MTKREKSVLEMARDFVRDPANGDVIPRDACPEGVDPDVWGKAVDRIIEARSWSDKG